MSNFSFLSDDNFFAAGEEHAHQPHQQEQQADQPSQQQGIASPSMVTRGDEWNPPQQHQQPASYPAATPPSSYAQQYPSAYEQPPPPQAQQHQYHSTPPQAQPSAYQNAPHQPYQQPPAQPQQQVSPYQSLHAAQPSYPPQPQQPAQQAARPPSAAGRKEGPTPFERGEYQHDYADPPPSISQPIRPSGATPPMHAAYPSGQPPAMQLTPPQQPSYYQTPPPAAGGFQGTVAALPSNNPYAPGGQVSQQATPQAQAQQPPSHQQNAGVPVGLPVQPGTSEIICPFCTVRLRYPLGAELVRCGSCQSISRVPPQAQAQAQAQAAMQHQQQAHQYAPPMQPTPLPSANYPALPVGPLPSSTRVQFKCSGCAIWLAADMAQGGGVTRCPKCATLMRPMLNMPTPSPVVSGGSKFTAAQVEKRDFLKAHYLANALPFPKEGDTDAAWVEKQHEHISKQLKTIMDQYAQAKQQEKNQMQQQQQQALRPPAQPVHQYPSQPAYAPQYPNSYPPQAHHGVVSAGSNFIGHGPPHQQQQAYQQQPQQPQQQRQYKVGDYSAMGSGQPQQPAQHQQQQPPSWSTPAVYPPASSAYSAAPAAAAPSDAEFNQQMQARMERLKVDEEGGQQMQPQVYRPAKPKADEKARPLLANEL